MTSLVEATPPPEHHARALTRRYTMAAMATGAVPVPAASVAVVAENAALITSIAAAYEVRVGVETVVASIGLMGTANFLGRQLFMEGARLLSWGAGPLGIAPVCALGAFTAGCQTWIIGELAIAICKNDGAPLTALACSQTLRAARGSFDAVWKDWRPQGRGQKN